MNATYAASLPPRHADGDTAWWACDLRDPRTLGPALLNGAENLRYVDGIPATRKGVVKPGWANKTSPAGPKIDTHGTPYGAGVFKDPGTQFEWLFKACAGYVYRALPYNQSTSVPLPTGVMILGRCTFVQAFNQLFLFRGTFLAPLVLTDFDDGFEDVVQHWDPATVYDVTDANGNPIEVAYGPYQTIDSLTLNGDTATVVTHLPHGYITGADVTVIGANEGAYNIRANITVLDVYTFTYHCPGAPASPATGAPKVSNSIFYWKALGSQVTLTSLVRTGGGTTAHATKNAHGFSNGQTVTIAGAVPADYNGTFVISNVMANTFDYALATDPGSDAAGVITARTSKVLAGQSPDTNPAAWTRQYNVLPNAATALFINNLLLVPTAYEPASADNYATFNGGAYTGKVDFLVATNYLDFIHFAFLNEFRINQGSADAIVDLAKFGESTAIIWKDKSWGILSNVSQDLSQIKFDLRSSEYGLSARGAHWESEADAFFVSNLRGVTSIRQSENGKFISVDTPLSAPIQKLIDRIEWTLAGGIRMANWNSHLYIAVPIDGGQLRGPELTFVPKAGTAQFDQAANTIAGQSYAYAKGAERAILVNHSIPGHFLTADGEFTPDGDTVSYFLLPNTTINASTAGTVRRITTGVNNAVLVFSFVSAAKLGVTEQGWCPVDTGPAMNVVEFVKMTINGLERLLFIDSQGFINLMEESDNGDQCACPLTSTVRDAIGTVLATPPADGLQWEEFVSYALTRAYGNQLHGLLRPVRASMAIQTWNPKYSAAVVFPGIAKRTTLDTDQTRSRTRYLRPFDKAPWDVSNRNNDFLSPNRGDYSVTLPTGISLGSGISLLNFQEALVTYRANGRSGRSFQFELANTQGKLRLNGVSIGVVTGRDRKGVQV